MPIGFGKTMRRVYGSIFDTEGNVPSIRTWSVQTETLFGSWTTCRLNATSSAVNGVPCGKADAAPQMDRIRPAVFGEFHLSASEGSSSNVARLIWTRLADTASNDVEDTRGKPAAIMRLNVEGSPFSAATRLPPRVPMRSGFCS